MKQHIFDVSFNSNSFFSYNNKRLSVPGDADDFSESPMLVNTCSPPLCIQRDMTFYILGFANNVSFRVSLLKLNKMSCEITRTASVTLRRVAEAHAHSESCLHKSTAEDKQKILGISIKLSFKFYVVF